MGTAKNCLQRAADEAGWNQDTQLGLLLEFITEESLIDELDDFLQEKLVEEDTSFDDTE